MTTTRVNVCIVGGGPGGMMLGLLLAKRGAEVLVLEGHENFDREFRGEVLQPSTSLLLDQLGLLEYVKELVSTGDYPSLAQMSGDDLDSLWAQIYAHATDDSRFDRNLARLLDGIARDLHTA